MKNIIKIVFVIIGTLVGAGFASGKEIYSFFFIYGKLGIFSMIISSGIIGFIIYKVLIICNKNKINTYSEFCDYLGDKFCGDNKIIKNLLNNVVNIFLLITYFVMIAGFSSFMKQEFNANGFISSIIIIILCYLVFLKNVDGLIKLSNFVIPVLIFFIIFISLKNINFLDNYNSVFCINEKINYSEIVEKNNNIFNDEICVKNVFGALLKAVLYSCYNCIIMIPVIITLNAKIKNERDIFKISVVSFVIITALGLAIYNILLQGNERTFQLEMPVIAVVSGYGALYKYVYISIIGISIFTTAVSSGCGFLNNCSKNKNAFMINLGLMSFCTVVVSQISFSVFVNWLYPVLGVVGIIEVLMIL